MKKSILAILIALCLMTSAIPIDVLAETENTQAAYIDESVRVIGADDWGEAPDIADLEEGAEPEDDHAELDAPVPGQLQDQTGTEELIFGTEPATEDQILDASGNADDVFTDELVGSTSAESENRSEDVPAQAVSGESGTDSEEAPVDVPEGKSVEARAEDSEENAGARAAEEEPTGETPAAPSTGDQPTETREAEEEAAVQAPNDAEADSEEMPVEQVEAASSIENQDQMAEAAASQPNDTQSAAVVQADTAATAASQTNDTQSAAVVQTGTTATTVSVEAGAVGLPYKTLRIGKGESVQLTPALGEGVTGVTYTSSKKKIVSVTADGVVKGIKTGTSYVTLKTNVNKKFKLKVVVKRPPSNITPNPNPLNLGIGETYTLGYKTPAGTACSAKFTGDAPSVFSVNEFTGEITGLAAGTGTVTLTTYNGKTATCPVTVYPAPTQVAFDPLQTAVGKKQKLQLQVKFDEGSWSNITYESENPAVAKVSSTGMVTGVAVGQTVIRAKTFVTGLYAETTFTVWGAPSKVWVDQKKIGGNVGQPFQLEPRIPVGSQTTFKYKSSKKKVATVSADGVVTPLKKGKTKITITTHNKKKVTLTLTVYDPGKPSSVKLKEEDPPVLYVGETWQAEIVTTPENADARMTWTSSNAAVATVDAQGVITATGFGQTTINAVSSRNKKLTIKFKLSVQTRELTLVIPDRTTDVAGIAGNMALINAIKDSTLGEIDRLRDSGAMSGDSASARKTIVENIFSNYAFPWMTISKQKYWKAANSEGGRKDFKAGKVYYGMPYISGSGANRHYSAALALSEERFTDSGQGYYVLNKGKYLKGKYVGNDCSGLVNVSIWGTESSHAADRTGDIYAIDAYNTIGSYDAMLPGDLLCKSNSHVVMFLYYASADKSRIMIIENGGSEKGTNTVHCDVKTVSGYKKSGYRIRRLASLG